jgi:hypothetical protein
MMMFPMIPLSNCKSVKRQNEIKPNKVNRLTLKRSDNRHYVNFLFLPRIRGEGSGNGRPFVHGYYKHFSNTQREVNFSTHTGALTHGGYR